MSAAEPKYTCDEQGNWTCHQVTRIRVGNGWVETRLPTPSDRADERKAA